MSISYREATPDDEATITALWSECGLVASYNDPAKDFQFALSTPSSTVLIAHGSQPTILGSVMVGHDGHRGWVYYVSTSREARGRGVGKGLVSQAELWLKDRGVAKCQLLIRESNAGVVDFYEKLGFQVAPTVVMGKWL